jgi:hypothetical protein
MTVLTIDQPTWLALRLIRDSLTFMNKNTSKYRLAIDKEKELYKYMIKEIYDTAG